MHSGMPTQHNTCNENGARIFLHGEPAWLLWVERSRHVMTLGTCRPDADVTKMGCLVVAQTRTPHNAEPLVFMCLAEHLVRMMCDGFLLCNHFVGSGVLFV